MGSEGRRGCARDGVTCRSGRRSEGDQSPTVGPPPALPSALPDARRPLRPPHTHLPHSLLVPPLLYVPSRPLTSTHTPSGCVGGGDGSGGDGRVCRLPPPDSRAIWCHPRQLLSFTNLVVVFARSLHSCNINDYGKVLVALHLTSTAQTLILSKVSSRRDHLPLRRHTPLNTRAGRAWES